MRYLKSISVLVLVNLLLILPTKGDLSITPSGLAAVFYQQDPQFVLSCTSTNTNDDNIIWELPVLYFADFLEYYNFIRTGLNGEITNDLPRRAQQRVTKNADSSTTSTLTVRGPLEWDEGYYTCKSGSQSTRIYVYVKTKTNEATAFGLTFNVDLNPLKMVYVVNRPVSEQSLILSCSWNVPSNLVKMILKRKTVDGRWLELNQPDRINIQPWELATDIQERKFNGLELRFSELAAGSFGFYRCAGWIEFFGSEIYGSTFVLSIEGSTESENNKPVIRPAVEFLVFQMGSTFNLNCEIGAGWNITWQSPSSTEKKTSTTVTRWTRSENDRITATLTVRKAGYLDMGFYTCRRSDNNSTTVEEKQFVFVQDWDRLILPTFSNSKPNVTLMASAIIGCVPTIPSVDVILSRKNGDQLIKVYSSLNGDKSGNWEYDFYRGFKIRNVTWDLGGEYICLGEFQTPSSLSGGVITYSKISRNHSFVIDVKGIELIPPDRNPIEGYALNLICKWKSYDGNSKTSGLLWRFRSLNQTTTVMSATMTSPIKGIEIKKTKVSNDGFYVSELSWNDISIVDAQGSSITCILGPYYSSSYTLNVLRARPPRIEAFFPESEDVYVNPGSKMNLTCQVDALPAPQNAWRNSKGVIDDKLNGGVYTIVSNKADNSSTTLSFDISLNFTRDDFKCEFTNSRGQTDSHTFRVRMTSPLTAGHIVGIVMAVLVFLLLIALLARTVHLNRKQRERTKMTRERLLQGDPGRMNPDAPLEDQVALIPYDPKWEFPRNRLVLGKQLGVGQFGIVVEARALGTVHDLKDRIARTVAVKMVKSSLDPTALISLASELKILIHLGPHLNVVNLLGACTKNVIEGELLVIEEFCCHGNLRDYLVTCRQRFVNELTGNGALGPPQNKNEQLNHEEGGEPCISPLLSQSASSSADGVSQVYKRSTNALYAPSMGRSFRESVFKMLGYKASFLPVNEEDVITLQELDGYIAPSGVESNDVDGNQDKDRIVSTRDLICWAFQIARGMDHLANKKVIHGDLAARNILLAEGNVVKIADFGLSRQIKYADGNYLKKGEEALPIKWMAIESLMDRIFSTQSDVWSYGVLLWEIFSLGQMPYSDITSLKDLIHFLREGQRLEMPVFSPDSIGDLMDRCWEKEPSDRPTFNELKENLGDMLGENVQQHYLKMDNDPYLNMKYCNEESASQK